MNLKVTQTLRTPNSGDIIKYFTEIDNFIQDNDDIQDNKILSQECYDKSPQIRLGNYTKFHLSYSLIDIINIDKCYLKCNMKYIIEANSESSNITFDNTLKDLDFFKIFVLFKSVTHNIEVYRIYINNQNIITKKQFNIWTNSCKFNETKCLHV